MWRIWTFWHGELKRFIEYGLTFMERVQMDRRFCHQNLEVHMLHVTKFLLLSHSDKKKCVNTYTPLREEIFAESQYDLFHVGYYLSALSV